MQKRSTLILLVVAASSFLATFNETFLNVALAPIMDEYQINEATVQWIVTAYMLVAAIMVPLTGFLYRSFPTRKLMLGALSMLLLGSALGWAAPGFIFVIGARAIQAVGTGMIIPLGMNLTLAVAPRNRLGTYMGIVGAMTTLGPAFGPIAAGGILQFTNWHNLFIIFAFLVLLVTVLAGYAVTNVAELSKPKLDIFSTLTVSLGLVSFMYGVSTVFGGNPQPGASYTIVGLIILAVFVYRQKRCSYPLLNLAPFSITGFNLGLGLVIIALMTVFSMNIILPVFMQSALGFSPLQAGLTLLPACLLACVLSPLVGRIYDRFGLGILAPLGMVIIALSVWGISRSSDHTTSAQLVMWYAPTIAGCSMVMGPAQSFALSQLEPRLHSHGSTILGTTFQLAGCIGSSLFMGVYALGAHIGTAASGFQSACWVAVALNLLGFILALVLVREEARAKTISMKRKTKVHTAIKSADTPAK